MMNVCFNCGLYRADKVIDPAGPHAICPECGYRHPFLRLPLLIVSGASGTGKSTVCHNLLGALQEAVLLDSDILWRSEFDKPESNYRDFFETWLRVCKNIAQSGRPVVLFGAGVGVPENMEPCVERRYFSVLHYLALICEDETLTERLQGRPGWRGSNTPAYIEEQLKFNRWFQVQGKETQPAIELVDTTRIPVSQTTQQVAAWISARVERVPRSTIRNQQSAIR